MNGLKALTFNQFWNLPYSENHGYYVHLGLTTHNVGEYHALVNQKFAPDLITKYFEGWVPNEYQYEGYPEYKNDKYVINIGIESSIIMYNEDIWMSLPETLDDFIRDCQRAGIELIFKVQNA